MKHKIIIIALVITTILAVLCISANAYEDGETIPSGTVIEFNETIDLSNFGNVSLLFESDENFQTEYKWFGKTNSTSIELKYEINNTTTYITAYNGTTWIKQGFKRIRLLQDWRLSANAATFINENATIPDPTLKNMLDDSKSFLSTALLAATLIITWLAANQICLCAMYLFILVAMVGVCKRFVKVS